MNWLILIIAILIVTLLFEVSPRLGGILIVILVLGYFVTVQQKGMLTQ